MEILSPAGSPEGLVASIKGGCDAVYLGGKTFGARAFSPNFSDKELQGAIEYAHDHKVKVHITVNTLIKDTEMDDAVSFVKFLQDIDADAVILQDLGLLRSIEKYDIPKHASTQMGIHNAAGLEWCYENGIDRAILARELTFDELSATVENSPVETEVFVQGALCYCISGGCLFSSIVGGRSGNRGRCAQPCRKKYKLGNREGYLLSSADIYDVSWLKKLESIGIDAVKIEGRMRSHAYAYLATKVYSDMNKDVPPEETAEDNDLLMTVFNRGYCDGYLGGVVSPVQSGFADNRGFFVGKAKITNRGFDTNSLKETVGTKDGLSIFSGDEKIGGFKLSNTGKVTVPFKMPDGTYEIYRTYDPRLDVIKNIVGEPPKFDGKAKRMPVHATFPDPIRRTSKKPELSFYVNSLKNLDAVLKYADRIYFDLNDHIEDARKMCRKANVECVTNIPRFLPSEDVPDHESLMIHSPGQIEIPEKTKIYGSYHTNMFNSVYRDRFYQTTLSVELSKNEIETIAGRYPGRLEMMVFGRIELMCTRDPGMENGILIDEKEFEFPVYGDDYGLSHILNSSDLLLLPYMKEISNMGMDSVGIDVRKRPSKLASLVAEAFVWKDLDKKSKITEMCGGINYGSYLKETE